MARAGVVVAAVLALGAAACGGGDGTGGGGTTPTAAPVGTRAPLPTVAVSGGTVTSSAWKYQAALPQGWRVSSNFIQSEAAGGSSGSPFGGDALFAPEGENKDPANPVQANIAIVCEKTDITDLDAFVKQKVDLQTNLKRQHIVVSDYGTVAGVPAKKIEYDFKRDTISFEKAEVYFLSPHCARSVSLTAQPGDRLRLQPQLEQVLTSIQVQ